jgi:hypothetical protein
MEGYMDHHSWLVNNNLLTDEMKDNIASAGFCLVEGVLDSAATIDFNKKQVDFKILVPVKLYNNLMLLEKFNETGKIGFFESFKLKKFIKAKKEHDETGMGYRLQDIGNQFIRAYLSKEWDVQVELFKEGNEEEDFWLHSEGDSQIN